MKYALELDSRLVHKPFRTRSQAAEALDIAIDTTPQMPTYELYVLVPFSDWDEMKDKVEDLSLIVADNG